MSLATRLLAVSSCALALGCSELGEARSAATATHLPEAERTLDAHELEQLRAGRRVSRAFEFRHRGGKYIATISFILVRATLASVMADASDVDSLARWLPHNHGVRVAGRDGAAVIVELSQGVDPFIASFSLRLTYADSVMRFELEPSRPHDIDDLWGFLSVAPYDQGRSLMLIGLALDLGDGLTRTLFEERIHREMASAATAAQAHFSHIWFGSGLCEHPPGQWDTGW